MPAISLLKAGSVGAFSEVEQSAAEARSSVTHRRLFWIGIALIGLFAALSLLLPETTMFGMAALILGVAIILPRLIVYLLSVALRLARRTNSAALRISVGELTATPTRATALAAVGTLAIFAILAITGPARDLERGLERLQTNIYSNGDIWISPRLEENPFITQPFNHTDIAKRLRRLPAVKSVHTDRTSFLDLADRRLFVIGESRSAKYPIAPSQILSGDLALATRRLRQGGWGALTETLADERNLNIGDRFSLPTPSGRRQFKLAATITNYAWSSGSAVINAHDFASAWNTQQASALLVDITDGVTLEEGKAAIQQALGTASPLAVRTAEENRAISIALTRQGFARLDQIANMVLFAAVLAAAAAMLGSVWQRRRRLLGLVSMGMGSGQLYRSIFLETGVILLIGCLIGVAFGFLGQFFGGRWLHVTTGYSVPFEPAWELATKALVLAIALAALAVTLPMRFVLSTKRVAKTSQE